LRLLILGDSAAAGVGVAAQAQALSGQLVAALGARFQVHWKLCARSGDAVHDVVRRLEDASVGAFDVALVSVGVNDATGRTSGVEWCAQLTRMIELLQARFAVRYILLTSLPPMHLFPALPQPLRWYLGTRAKQLDQMMTNVVAEHTHCERLALRLPVAGTAIAADGFHPGTAAYAAWAQLAATAIQARVAQGELRLDC
jgi:lysophospholipase L1-like esterase